MQTPKLWQQVVQHMGGRRRFPVPSDFLKEEWDAEPKAGGVNNEGEQCANCPGKQEREEKNH